MGNKIFSVLLILLLGVCVGLLFSCQKVKDPLVVYSGKGLKSAMEEVRQVFEKEHGRKITIVYAGSQTLLNTIRKTRKGDVFVPGSAVYIVKAGDLVVRHELIAKHVPAFAARVDGLVGINKYDDLAVPGVRIAIGNKDMCAIGRAAEKIIVLSGEKAEFAKNIVVTASTVNELLALVAKAEVDASLVWKDMLEWPEAEDLVLIEIPSEVNIINDIPAAVLATTMDREGADLFMDFMSKQGKAIFLDHGYGQ